MSMHKLFGLAFLTAFLHAQEALDTIVKQDGASVRGVSVTTFSLTSVKFLRNKEEVELPPHQVADIQWGGVPDAFTSGMAALARNDYETARQQFGEAVNKTDRAVLKAEARLLQGKAAALAGAGDPAAAANAAGALRAWIGEFPDNWRLPEATYLLGRSLRMGQAHSDAETTLKELDDRAGRDGWGAMWNARAKYELALCLLEQNKALDARSAFQSAGGAADTAMAAGARTDEMAAIKVNARVGEGESLIQEKSYDRAADFFRTLSQNDDMSLAAAGKAGQGEAMFYLASASNDANGLRGAEIALAEACVLDTGAGDTAAKANYYLGRVLTALGDRAGQDWGSRAKAYFTTVTKSYPSSRWVSSAKAELTK
jgi:TolA-binding protein